MVRTFLVTLPMFTIGRRDLAFRNHFTEVADELDLVEGPAFDVVSMGLLLSGLSTLQPVCGLQLLANISMHKAIEPKAFTLRKGGGVIVSRAFKDFDNYYRMLGTIPVTPGMSLYMIGRRFAGALTSAKQVTAVINQQIKRHGSVQVAFDAGLDIRSCWRDIVDTKGMKVCGANLISDLAGALKSLPADPQKHLGSRGGATVIRNYPRFIFRSLSEERALLAEAMPNISSSFTKLERDYGVVYATGLTPMCVVLPGFDGTDWLVMRKVHIPGAKVISFSGRSYLDLKGPKFNWMRDGNPSFDSLWSGKVAKFKDPGFAAVFPTGLTVSSCGGREVAFSMEKDVEMLEALAMNDFSLLIQFYEADLDTAKQCGNTRRRPTFPIVLDVVKPSQFRIALGIIDYVEETTASLSPSLYREYWMHMWPRYFNLSTVSLQEYRSEIFAKRMRGLEVSKVVALTRLTWSEANIWEEPYYKVVIHEAKAFLHTRGSAYKVFPGEQGIVEGEVEDGLLVHWDKYKSDLFWVAPQNVMPVPR